MQPHSYIRHVGTFVTTFWNFFRRKQRFQCSSWMFDDVHGFITKAKSPWSLHMQVQELLAGEAKAHIMK